MIAVGWATGGGAAQILFSIFGELVFNRGPAGIGTIWGCAGLGLLCGGAIAYKIGPRLSFAELQAHDRRSATSCTAGRTSCSARCGISRWALVFIALSRAGGGGELHAEYDAAAAHRAPMDFAGASSPPSNPCSGG